MNAFDYFFEKTNDLEKSFLSGKENISFRDLYISTVQLASYLEQQYGQGKNMLLISPNSLFFLIAYFSIIKSGNICIPLDPFIEKENLNYIAGLTKPSLIFIPTHIKERLSLINYNYITPETINNEEFKGSLAFKNQNDFDNNRPAEIIFTSGSTGKPKGVIISHKNLISNTNSIISYLKLNQGDRILIVLPFYYCYGLSLLHTHLRIGGSIILNNTFIFLGTVINDLIEFRCTGFAGVPSHFQILLRKTSSFKKTSFPDLKYVTQAGGKLATVFIDEFRESFPGIKFYVMYGQTEATARLSYLPPEMYEKKKGSIGKGIPGVELRVVNEMGENILPGETGEIIARGDNIMTGYFADDVSTRNSIRNGWLFTGDLAITDKDGFIFLVGRNKEFIKAGGKRISPKEIEEVIFTIPEVLDCTVNAIEDDLLGEAIKATIVVNSLSASHLTERTVQDHCAKKLATFKIPKRVEFIETMSFSPTGKKIAKKL